MNAEQLKNMLADVDDDLPVLVKTADGWKRVSFAYEEILWDEKIVPGNELQAFCIELVTPMEEPERYVVEPSDVAWFVVDKKHESGEQNVVMYMRAFHPNPKAAAEAECKRLNAEHRKNQK